jgi:hypothetical protein
METSERLKQMIGNVYEYEGEKTTVLGVEMEDRFAILQTDTGDIKISLADVDTELKEFRLRSNNSLILKNGAAMNMIGQSGNTYGSLSDTLLDTIEKIKSSPEYIPQAQAINETVKAIIDLEKVKIQTLNLLKS